MKNFWQYMEALESNNKLVLIKKIVKTVQEKEELMNSGNEDAIQWIAGFRSATSAHKRNTTQFVRGFGDVPSKYNKNKKNEPNLPSFEEGAKHGETLLNNFEKITSKEKEEILNIFLSKKIFTKTNLEKLNILPKMNLKQSQY